MYLKIHPQSWSRATIPLALALVLFALAAGFSKDSNTNNSSGSANSNNAPVNVSPSANTTSTANTSSTTKPAGISPTEVVKGYYEAGMKKDIAGVKRFLSHASLQLMGEIAKREGKTLDQLFTEAAEMDARKPQPVFSNERIVGNTAIVDIVMPGKPVVAMPLVKEEGEWKLAFGKPKSGAIKR